MREHVSGYAPIAIGDLNWLINSNLQRHIIEQEHGGARQADLTPLDEARILAVIAMTHAEPLVGVESIAPEASERLPAPPAIVTPWPGAQHPLRPELARAINDLQNSLGLTVLLLVQQGSERPMDDIGDPTREGLRALLGDLPRQHIGLLIDSPGGYARSAYQIARLLQRHCGGFTAIVPRQAKSAATILALGADRILMHEHAELGPLDAQVFDPDREAQGSALDEVQALERLHAQALELVDSTMALMITRTGKRVETLLPTVMNFVAQTTRPLFEKIDAVHFTATSRTLRVAEQYAIKLLERKYSSQQA
jgi:hypothetical protein